MIDHYMIFGKQLGKVYKELSDVPITKFFPFPSTYVNNVFQFLKLWLKEKRGNKTYAEPYLIQATRNIQDLIRKNSHQFET